MEGTSPYICSCYLCDSAFVSVGALNYHLSESSRHPSCPKCYLRCRDNSALQTHLRVRHSTQGDTGFGLDRRFQSTSNWTPHGNTSRTALPVQFACGDCGKSFDRSEKLSSHQQSKKHGSNFFKCNLCQVPLGFTSLAGLNSHKASKHGSTGASRTTPLGGGPPKEKKKQKKKKPKNFGCGFCEQKFVCVNAVRDHTKTKHSQKTQMPNPSVMSPKPVKPVAPAAPKRSPNTTFHCLDCNKEFKSKYSLDSHLEMKVHKPRPATTAVNPNTCEICNKSFKSASGLSTHKQSKAHKPPTPGLECIKQGCGRKFDSPSAMLRHLESGSCSPEITRQTINALIFERDDNSIITDKALREPEAQRLALLTPQETIPHLLCDATPDTAETDAFELDSQVGYRQSTPDTAETDAFELDSQVGYDSDDSDSGVLLTPTTPADSECFETLGTLTSSFEVTSLIPRKKSVRCPLCPKTHRHFQSAKSLQEHLSSAAHAPKIFHCPVSLFTDDFPNPKKKKTHMAVFSTLSGLTDHLESKACKGGSNTFVRIMKFVEEKLREVGIESEGLRLLTDGRATV